jgi:starvation-inducible DNA-binding protein
VVDLSLQGKQLHWTVVGPLFRPLHLQIDELVEAWRELADTDAESGLAQARTSFAIDHGSGHKTQNL